MSGGPADPAGVALVGLERRPVVCAEQACDDFDGIRRAALESTFAQVGPYYPGVRAPPPAKIVDTVIRRARSVLQEQFDARSVHLLNAYFSLITTASEALTLPQRVPHYDGVEPERIALLLYMTGTRFGGTSFYRHRATGFETIIRDRLPGYFSALRAEFSLGRQPGPSYIVGDTPQYERVHTVEAQSNRLVIYPGNLLHSADVRDGDILSADPAKGRLTLNVFIMINH